MALTESYKKFLDSLKDNELLYYLNLNFGKDIPIWKEISQKEYEKHCGKFDPSDNTDKAVTLNDLIKFSPMLSLGKYKIEPVYKDAQCGILFWLYEAPKRNPDGYKFYKRVGYKHTLLLHTDLAEYYETRKRKEYNHALHL